MRNSTMLALTLTLVACASDPMQDALLGQPRKLSKMVIAGEVKPNVYVKGFSKNHLPLCLLIEYINEDARAAFNKLLSEGSDINMSCVDDPAGNKAQAKYPLDYLLDALVKSMGLPDPYWGMKSNPLAVRTSYLQALADRLIDQGALLGGNKRVSKAEFRQMAEVEIQAHNEYMLGKQESYNKQIASHNAFVSGVASVGQVALGAYVVKEASKTNASNIALAQLTSGNGITSPKPMDSGLTRNGMTSSSTQQVRSEVQQGTRPAAAAPLTPPAPKPGTKATGDAELSTQIKAQLTPAQAKQSQAQGDPLLNQLKAQLGPTQAAQFQAAVDAEAKRKADAAKASQSQIVAQAPTPSPTSTAAAPAKAEQPYCVSYGHQLLKDQYVCYANSMEQYACRSWRGKYGLERVQKLVLGSSLNDKNLCDHVDRANNKPAIESMLVF